MVRGAWLCGPQSHVHGCQPEWNGLSLGSDGPPRTEADALWVIEVQCGVIAADGDGTTSIPTTRLKVAEQPER
jgi:hypothetical protein